MIPLPLRHESRERLEFAHRPGPGWGVAALGALLYGGLVLLAGSDWRLLWTFEPRSSISYCPSTKCEAYEE